MVGTLIGRQVSLPIIFGIFTAAILIAAGAVLTLGEETMHQALNQ
jgi:putative MFS transporter